MFFLMTGTEKAASVRIHSAPSKKRRSCLYKSKCSVFSLHSSCLCSARVLFFVTRTVVCLELWFWPAGLVGSAVKCWSKLSWGRFRLFLLNLLFTRTSFCPVLVQLELVLNVKWTRGREKKPKMFCLFVQFSSQMSTWRHLGDGNSCL